MNLAFLDFETQCTDAGRTNATEVGARLVCLGTPMALIAEISQLCWDDTYPPQSDEVYEITGISDAMLATEGKPIGEVFQRLLYPLIEQADVVVAHNKSFDQTVYESVSKRLGLTPPQPKRGWVCSIQDVPYAKKFKCKKLSHLAYDHGILVHPDTLHRALDDVRLLEKLFLENYDVEMVLAYRDSPWVYLKAETVTPWTDGGVSNMAAKKLGYSYEKAWGTDKPTFAKTWVKRVKEEKLPEEKLAAEKAGIGIKRLLFEEIP